MPAGADGNPRNAEGEPPRSHALDQGALGHRIIGLLEADLAREGYELLDVRVFKGGGRLQVRIYLDIPGGGITLDGVAKASRSSGMLLEEADLIPGKYVIEVSSPGIRRPLRTVDHFLEAVGERLDLKVNREGSSQRIRGDLLEVRGDVLVIMPRAKSESPEDVQPVEVGLVDIAEANLDPEFDAQALINADRRQRKEQRRNERKAKAELKARKRRPRKESSKGGKGESDPDSGQ